MDEIINKVAQSKIFTLEMEDFLPLEKDLAVFDIADYLFQGIVLKEKDFRAALKEMDWSRFKDRCVLVFCSADAILPIWSYMLVVTHLEGIARASSHSKTGLYLEILGTEIQKIHQKVDLTDRPIVIKGCSNIPEKESLYLEATKRLMPYAKTIMYGEPCSTVPIFKKKKQ